MRKLTLLLMCSLPAAVAQDTGRAVLGYVVDAVRIELRAVEGTTGAVRFSEPLALPEGVRRIDLASGQRWALLDRGADLPPLDLDLDTGAVRELPVAEGGFARVVSSPNGRRVALLRDQRYEVWERNDDGFTRVGEGAIDLNDVRSAALSNSGVELAVARTGDHRAAVGYNAEGGLIVVTDGGALLDSSGNTLLEDPDLAKSIAVWAGDPGFIVAMSTNKLWRVDLADGSIVSEELHDARSLDRWRVTGLLHLGSKTGDPAQLYSTLAAAEQRKRWIPVVAVVTGGAQ